MQGMNIFNETVLRQSRQTGASAQVVAAVRQASANTGVDFSYLMEKAAVESGFDPNAKAGTSSATGLYQFTEGTWLDMVAQHGARHGLGSAASQIAYNGNGTPVVVNAADRQKILDLRKDPVLAAGMAAELARDNRAQLQSSVGGQIGGTELYLAHFLGAGGAAKFIDAYRQNPRQAASSILPEAAAANPAVFNDPTSNKPCTLAQIYDRFAAHFGGSTFTSGSDSNSCNLTPHDGTLGTWTSPQELADRAVPGVGGNTLSLYAILTLAALNVPTHEDEEAIRDKNGPWQTGRTLIGL